MEKKIYVAGMTDEKCEAKVNDAVSAIAGVSSCTANAMKAHVIVNFDEGTAGIEDAINAAISGCGFDVLG
ncbi:MAG: heavy-metal-associated domain-containing protein [Treponema sp.]|nr:heavy-metal-associated domain-containing protein [Treponema sp.]